MIDYELDSLVFCDRCTAARSSERLPYSAVIVNPPFWPRCIPRGCVSSFQDEVKNMGQCHCEFNECQEYIFNLVRALMST